MCIYAATNASPHQTDHSVAHILVNWIANGVNLDKALDFLITEVDGFGDDPFLKRAFLFFLQLNRILGLYEDEVKEFPVPADYQVPKMLNHYKIIEYSDVLQNKIDLGIHLTENGPEEMAIRAATIIACQKLGEITGWSASDVDGWFFIRRKEPTSNWLIMMCNGFLTRPPYGEENRPRTPFFKEKRPLWVNPELNATNAFVAAWLPGSEGAGVADVLFSDSNGAVRYDFTGTLSFSWPMAPTQFTVNRGDADYAPLFPYGFGLNYADTDTLGTLPETP